MGKGELFWGAEGQRCSRVGMGRSHLEWGEVFWGGEERGAVRRGRGFLGLGKERYFKVWRERGHLEWGEGEVFCTQTIPSCYTILYFCRMLHLGEKK